MQINENNCAQERIQVLLLDIETTKTMDSIGIKINTEESSCVPSNLSHRWLSQAWDDFLLIKEV